MTFNEQLHEARRASGLSQEQLAEQMDLSRQAISHWENGRTLPDAKTMKRLSHVLNCNFMEENEPAASAPEAAEEESGEASEASPKAVPSSSLKNNRILWCAVCLIVGMALGWSICFFTTPKTAPTEAPVSSGVSKRTNATQAAITISTDENLVVPRYMDETAKEPMWIYRIYFTETAGINFTVEKMTQTHVNDDGRDGYSASYTAAQLGLGDGVIVGGSSVFFGGGMPVQTIKGIRFTVFGTDGMGNKLNFEEYIPFSKVIPE